MASFFGEKGKPLKPMKKYISTIALIGASFWACAQSQPTTSNVSNKDRALKFPYDDGSNPALAAEEQTVKADSSDYPAREGQETRKRKTLFVQKSGFSSRSKAAANKEE